MTQRWEHMILDVNVGGFFVGPNLDGDALTARLNELGAEGWEVAATSGMETSQGRTRYLVLILKRPRP